MSRDDPISGAERDPLEMLAEEFVERHRRGERPPLSEYTGKYPHLAEAIVDLFPALLVMEQVKPAGDERLDRDGPSAGPTTDRIGDFRILREIARGGMGVVYEAMQESLGRHVALKILPLSGRLGATQLGRFQLEARSAARLHHGNIVPVYGVGEHQGVHYYAMQFIQGHGLDAILDDLRKLRRLDPGSMGPREDDALSSLTARPPDSMTLACSLMTGAVARAATSAGDASADTFPAAPSQTVAGAAADKRPGPKEPGAVIRPDPAGLAPTNADNGMIETASLSLTARGQFYRSVARIGRQVADALAYAHQQGVLHRDIKPSNLLLDVAGKVWVTDFGLAKLEGSDGPTRTGDIVGTIRYMAPERFDGWSDRRSDVYSLGATLYELLTLRPLFGASAQAALIERVLHDPPEAPRRIDPRIPRDLETIVLKAISKEPGRRYATAQAMGEDLGRFLDDHPILARRSSTMEQGWRWCRRNPLVVAALATAAAAVVTLAIVSAAMAWKFREQRDQIAHDLAVMSLAEARERRARIDGGREQKVESLLDRARIRRLARQPGQRFESLAALTEAAEIARELGLPHERLDPLRDEAIACLALPDVRPEPGGRRIRRPAEYVAFAFDPTMTLYAFGLPNGAISVRRATNDEEVGRFRVPNNVVFTVFAFSPDGRYLAAVPSPGEALSVWDVGRRVDVMHDPGPVQDRARFSPDSRRIALARKNGEVLVYNLATGRPETRWRVASPGPLAFRFDSARIAVVLREDRSSCQILETETGRLVRSIPLPALGDGVAWSPDGTTLSTPCENRTICIWDADTGTRKATLVGHNSGGLCSAFHPAGMLLASSGWERRLWLWDPVLGRPWLNLPGRSHPPLFTRDGRIVTAIEDRFITYEVDPALEYRTFAHASAETMDYGAVAVRVDGRLLALGTSRGVALWDLAHGKEIGFLPIDGATNLRFEASGDLLTAGSKGQERWPVRLDPDRSQFRIGPPCRVESPAGFEPTVGDGSGRPAVQARSGRGLCTSADGRLVAIADRSRVLRLMDARTGRTLARLTSPDLCEAWAATFSPDASRLVVSTRDGPASHLWDLRAIRRRLAGMGLDWDAPAYPTEDPANSSAPGLPRLRIDYGAPVSRIEHAER
jgi:eukaryotic-like serine/threonine-protein kinase